MYDSFILAVVVQLFLFSVVLVLALHLLLSLSVSYGVPIGRVSCTLLAKIAGEGSIFMTVRKGVFFLIWVSIPLGHRGEILRRLLLLYRRRKFQIVQVHRHSAC